MCGTSGPIPCIPLHNHHGNKVFIRAQNNSKKETAEAIPPAFPSSCLMVPSLEPFPVGSPAHPVLDPTSALEISSPTVFTEPGGYAEG